MPLAKTAFPPIATAKFGQLPASRRQRLAAHLRRAMGGRYLNHAPKKVVLVGMGPSLIDLMNETLTQELTPDYCDEVWAINMASNMLWHDLVFWMDDLKKQEEFRPGLFDLLRKRGKPVITSKAYPDIVPTSYDYPVSECSSFGIEAFGKPYLANGVAMAIAYAMHIGVQELKIYGCDFTYPNRNYAEEGRGCVEAWIMLAHLAKGMTVAIPPSTSLFDTVRDKGVYGYDEQPEITLPDGNKFKYMKKQGQAEARYQPEDSSGESSASEHQAGASEPGEPPVSADAQWTNGLQRNANEPPPASAAH